MVAKSFEIGDLVWAKMKGYPPWPGKIMDPPANAKIKKAHHYVFFYGSENYAWIPDEGIFLHEEKLVEKYAKDQKRPTNFRSAVEAIVNASKGSSKYTKDSESNYEMPATKEEASPKSKSLHSNSAAKKTEIKKKVPAKKITVKKDSRKRASSSGHNGADRRSFELPPKKEKIDEDFSGLFDSIQESHHQKSDDDESEVTPTPALCSQNAYIDRPQTPSIDLETVSDDLKVKEISPTHQKIGFLGLGRLGQGVVKNLIQSGHSVTVWNRTPSKCNKFVAIGAEKEQTPADVIIACDITFCCVSDPEVSKELVFGNCGVLKGLESYKPLNSNFRKGYVELTSLDPQTSQAIHDEVTLKGGRYLEAPLTGSREEAIEGNLFVLGAGDRDLFNECKSCFLAMGKESMFVSVEVGNASKYNIVHSMLVGTVYAAVAESLALIERLGLAQSDFLDILHYGVLNSSVVIQKGYSMIRNEYTSNTPLKHIQKDLNLALSLGHSVEQSMPIAAAANEVYKHCKLLRYAEHDVGAVYEGTKR